MSWAQDTGGDFYLGIGAVSVSNDASTAGIRTDRQSSDTQGVRVVLGYEKPIFDKLLLGAEAQVDPSSQKLGRGDKIHYSRAILAKLRYHMSPPLSVYAGLGAGYAKTNAQVSKYESFTGPVFALGLRYQLNESNAVDLSLEQTAYSKRSSEGQTVDLKQTRAVLSYLRRF